jgi:hypothetical protein
MQELHNNLADLQKTLPKQRGESTMHNLQQLVQKQEAMQPGELLTICTNRALDAWQAVEDNKAELLALLHKMQPAKESAIKLINLHLQEVLMEFQWALVGYCQYGGMPTMRGSMLMYDQVSIHKCSNIAASQQT